jgi:hypothetical protein
MSGRLTTSSAGTYLALYFIRKLFSLAVKRTSCIEPTWTLGDFDLRAPKRLHVGRDRPGIPAITPAEVYLDEFVDNLESATALGGL